MSRNLYILAATLGLLALISIGIAVTHIAHSPGDQSLWRTMGLGMVVVALVVALGAVLTSLLEQAERKSEEQRLRKRQR